MMGDSMLYEALVMVVVWRGGGNGGGCEEEIDASGRDILGRELVFKSRTRSKTRLSIVWQKAKRCDRHVEPIRGRLLTM